MRKNFILGLLLIIAVVLGACTPGTTPAEEVPAEEPAKPVSVCISLYGRLGDQSYNDSVAEGVLQAAEDFGIEYKMLEANETADREPNTIACADGGYDLVVAVGSGQLDIVKNAAEEFPNQKFAITDAILYPTPENVVSIAFAPNEGQFLVGAAMAMLTTKTEIPGINEEKIVGWISGTENPNIDDFWAGFQHGVEYIDPEIEILQAYAGSWGDPIKGKELATAQYELGADVIANVAAGTGLGIFEAAEELEKFVVGVDINQDDIAPGFVLTSMLKHVGVGVYQVIESVVNDEFDGGGYIYMDLAAGGIELTDFSIFKEKWGDLFPEDIVEKMEELTKMIANGEIKVRTNPDIRFWE